MAEAGLSVFNERGDMVCPKCDSEYCHFVQVDVIQGQDSTIIQAERTLQVKSDLQTSARGSEVILHIYCEEGHKFRVRMAFHKGTITLYYSDPVDLPIIVDGNLERPDYPDGLWRD
jgi:hypothetical protein